MLQWWTVPGKDGGVLEQRQVPVPEAGPGQVLIKVVGAGVNPYNTPGILRLAPDLRV